MGKVTRAMLKEIRVEMDKVLEEVGKKYGVEFETGNASFEEYSFTFKVNGKMTSTENGESVEKAEWDKYCGMYGLKPEDFGRIIDTNFGKRLQIIGIKPGSKKNQIRLVDLNTNNVGVGPAFWVKNLINVASKA